MKPAAFEYYRASTIKEAVELLGRHGAEAKVLAGGQSLLPMMKLRLARPTALVDINRIRDLGYVRAANGALAFGALARLDELESSQVSQACPLLTAASHHIGHTAIRNRGTVCGSLAHSDPAAELPVLALALDAEVVATGPRGQRVIPARDLFVTYLTTTLAPDEILTEARFPTLRPRTGWGFAELSRRTGDFAIAIAAAVLEMSPAGVITSARIALGAVADRALRAEEAEKSLVGTPGSPQAFEAAAALATASLDPPTDVHGSGSYRRHLASVLVARALAQAWERVAARSPHN